MLFLLFQLIRCQACLVSLDGLSSLPIRLMESLMGSALKKNIIFIVVGSISYYFILQFSSELWGLLIAPLVLVILRVIFSNCFNFIDNLTVLIIPALVFPFIGLATEVDNGDNMSSLILHVLVISFMLQILWAFLSLLGIKKI